MNVETTPGERLHRKVRIAFISKDTTLGAWCKAHDVNPAAARAALLGGWTGPGAKRLCARLVKASGITLGQNRAA